MPYYCTVPRCTSMAGKAKNVSFHQFPRDEELARLWNDILKRGKPYTKYSKVCSLHFKPEDYTITSVGKNKGQWRTLRKDAVPSQNLPSETPAPYSRKQWDTWSQGSGPNVMDTPIHHQMAQAIYMQTMMAMQAAGSEPAVQHNGPKLELPNTSHHEDVKQKDCTYRCTECTKCFKDPDVFILHKRTHTKDKSEKENFNMNLTLRSNPILANLLKTEFDPNVAAMENLLMTALAANMDYLRNYTTAKEEHYEGFESRGDAYNRDENQENGHVTESRQKIDAIDLDRNKNGYDQDIANRSYDRRDRSDSNDVCDLNRLKNDLNRRSVEIHVRTGLSQSDNDYVNDLTPSKDSTVPNCVTESASDNTEENNIENLCDSRLYKHDVNEKQSKASCIDDSRENSQLRYAMNFMSQVSRSYKSTYDYNEAKSVHKAKSVTYGSNGSIDPNLSRESESVADSSHCDNDLNESLDSNSLVIDEGC